MAAGGSRAAGASGGACCAQVSCAAPGRPRCPVRHRAGPRRLPPGAPREAGAAPRGGRGGRSLGGRLAGCAVPPRPGGGGRGGGPSRGGRLRGGPAPRAAHGRDLRGRTETSRPLAAGGGTGHSVCVWYAWAPETAGSSLASVAIHASRISPRPKFGKCLGCASGDFSLRLGFCLQKLGGSGASVRKSRSDSGCRLSPSLSERP